MKRFKVGQVVRVAERFRSTGFYDFRYRVIMVRKKKVHLSPVGQAAPKLEWAFENDLIPNSFTIRLRKAP